MTTYRFKFLYSLLLAILALFTSCIQELEWIENDSIEPKLVVEGLITSEQKAHSVKLSRSRGVVVNGKPEAVSGANISISDGDQVFPLNETSPGLYQTDSTVIGEVGKAYKLRIELNGEIYTAIDTMIEATAPRATTIREAEFAPGFYWFEYPGNFGAEAPAKLSLQVITPAGWADNFPTNYEITERWQERKEGHIGVDSTYYIHPYLEPPALLAYGIIEVGIYPLGTEIHFSHASLSEGYYTFIRALMSETEWKGLGPFGYNPANLPTNVSNGAVGYFGTSHIKEYVQVISE